MQWDHAREVGSNLFDDIYRDQSARLRDILAHSHPDQAYFIVQHVYGPLFAPPSAYDGTPPDEAPAWEVNRLRVSLTTIAALHAQGGVGPQVTSHIYGLLRSPSSFAHVQGPERAGLDFLASTQGAEWLLRTINHVCFVVNGTEDADREGAPHARL